MTNRLISCLILSVIGLLTYSCSAQKAKQKEKMLNFKDGDYAQAWQTIDSLDRLQQPKSALAEVNKLYDRVKKEENPGQEVKCLIYQTKYLSELEEEGISKRIYRLQNEIEKSDFPVKPVLYSMLGQLYSDFLSNNYWHFQNRTAIEDFDETDILTWPTEKLLDAVRDNFLASLEDERTQTVDINSLSAIISKGQNTEGTRPTLYDFLAHRAIDYLSNERNMLNEPINQFYIDQEEALGNLTTFMNYPFSTDFPKSNKYQTLRIFQKLLKSHLLGSEGSDVTAMLDTDLRRMTFVYEKSIIKDKRAIYLKTLEEFEKQDSEFSTAAAYQRARLYFNDVQFYNGVSEDQKWNYKTAYDICETAIKKFPKSYGASQCRFLQSQILEKDLTTSVEKVVLPNQPILSRLSYRNIDQVFIKVIPVTEAIISKFNKTDWDKRADYMNGLDPAKMWTEKLIDDGDYLPHDTEFKIDALGKGTYLLMVANTQNFSDKNNGIAYSFFNVSNISYTYRNNEQGQMEYVVMDRTSGAPMAGVKASFYQRKYNSSRRDNDYLLRSTITSDDNGFIKTDFQGRESYRVKFEKGDDVFYPDNYYSTYKRNNSRATGETVHFFLDRKIYRPGQAVYFKGIATQKDVNGIPSIIANRKVEVILQDPNRQEKGKLTLRTNEFGTFNGSFIAPDDGLLGRMTIKVKKMGNIRFSVEEYKRPKFEVTFNPVKESFKLNDKVTVKGNAKAYAGSNIDGAKVTYRVIRTASFPYWYRYSRGYYRPPYSNNNAEIAFGETTTDEQGNFEITFDAVPDKTISPDKKPQFNYMISADVVDITGETHSSQQYVSVGYVALAADLEVGGRINIKEPSEVKIITKNLNGEFEAAQGTIVIEELSQPNKVFKKRLWQSPDLYLLSKENYDSDFPDYNYEGEDEKTNWAVRRQIFKTDFDTEKETEIKLLGKGLESGVYKITMQTKDKYGVALEVIKFFDVYDLNSNKAPSNTPVYKVFEQTSYEPGETALYHIATAYDKLNVLFEVEHDNKIIEQKWTTVAQLKDYKLKIKEKHRGNVFFHFTAVKDNRSYTWPVQINVPWANKELNFEYATFRNKLLPGQDEEWQIKISGNKKDKVAAEMVATLYDASLDAFAVNSWGLNLYPTAYARRGMSADNFNSIQSQLMMQNHWVKQHNMQSRSYDQLIFFSFANRNYRRGRSFLHDMNPEAVMKSESAAVMDSPAMEDSDNATDKLPKRNVAELASKTAGVSTVGKSNGAPPPPPPTDEGEAEPGPEPQIRTNLNETVFFMPDLMTDADGNVIVKFKMNEALTRWKFLGMAHTKDLKIGFTENEVVTQKDLMVMPNAPRFFREGDEIEFTAKVSNLSKEVFNGTAEIKLFDALTMQPVNDLLGVGKALIPFTAEPGQSARLAWNLKIPLGKVQAITHQVIAKAGKFSDGEESTLPILTNRMMVTETMPLPVRGKSTKTFNFDRLKNANSTTLQHHQLTLEFTSNPAWYAVQALPYLMEYPYECTEQIFSRFYANALASSVANSHPKVRKIFDQWKNTDAMLSNLSKNQELKTALLEETPWVLNAQSEEEQKKNIGLLFDLNRMSKEQAKAIKTIAERQLGNGGFSWFPGGRDSWYITQYLVEGFGHLNVLGVNSPQNDLVQNMMRQSVKYIDDRLVEHYNELKKRVKKGNGKMEDNHLDYLTIHYLYARSFFMDIERQSKANEAYNYYLSQAEKYWTGRSLYMQGMIALALQRNNKKTAPALIVKSFKERSLNNDEMGMYWKYDRGYYWYQLPIETHALMIEVFDEVADDSQAVDDLKVWLLKNKQTTHWKTTKATAAAVYALLRRGANWLLEDQPVEISLGGKKLDQSKIQKEAGTGYFKTSWPADEVNTEKGTVEVKNPNSVVAWGAMYWQYFEQLDKITTFEETPLTLEKQLFLTENTDSGPKLKAIGDNQQLQPGDKLTVRIVLRVDRDMEYVHMKDMRASGFEPMNVISRYKWQGGLGYYESTRDASTNFFFSYLPKGTHVFEYPLRVIHKGDFSNGITTIQCMYAPEFTSHSEGTRVKVE